MLDSLIRLKVLPSLY